MLVYQYVLSMHITSTDALQKLVAQHFYSKHSSLPSTHSEP